MHWWYDFSYQSRAAGYREVSQARAERRDLYAQAKAQSRMLEYDAEGHRLRALGITYQEEMQHELNKLVLDTRGKGVSSALVKWIETKIGIKLNEDVLKMVNEVPGAPIDPIGGKRASETWKCPRCDGERPIDDLFCTRCGQKQPPRATPWTCACGSANGPDARYCPKCGCARSMPWTCACGNENSAAYQFCPKCSQPKPTRTENDRP